MNVLIAPDSFKDSLSAEQVADAIEKGILMFAPTSKCTRLPASDGGEGFLKAVQSYLPELEIIETIVEDPLGRDIKTDYLWDNGKKTAYIELAKASGLQLLTLEERTPMHTSTYGTGLQMKHAIAKGAKKIYLGIGGSATNDGGTGIAAALGFSLFSEGQIVLRPSGKYLSQISRIVRPENNLKTVSFFAVNDVENPLYGEEGAAYIYAGQKGATPKEILTLDLALQNLDRVVKNDLNKYEAHIAGAGAAGGTAYGLKCFLNASFIGGTSFMLNLARFKKIITEEKIDVIITGEGRIDAQTAHGKFIFGLAQEAKILNVPVLGLCGKLELTPSQLKGIGLDGAAQIYDPSKPVSYSYENAESLATQKTFDLLKEFYR